MNFSSGIMFGKGISLGGLELATDYLYNNSDLYEPELSNIKATISNKPAKNVLPGGANTKPKMTREKIIDKFALKQEVKQVEADIIIDSNMLVSYEDDFDFSFDSLENGTNITEEIGAIENNVVEADNESISIEDDIMQDIEDKLLENNTNEEEAEQLEEDDEDSFFNNDDSDNLAELFGSEEAEDENLGDFTTDTSDEDYTEDESDDISGEEVISADSYTDEQIEDEEQAFFGDDEFFEDEEADSNSVIESTVKIDNIVKETVEEKDTVGEDDKALGDEDEQSFFGDEDEQSLFDTDDEQSFFDTDDDEQSFFNDNSEDDVYDAESTPDSTSSGTTLSEFLSLGDQDENDDDIAENTEEIEKSISTREENNIAAEVKVAVNNETVINSKTDRDEELEQMRKELAAMKAAMQKMSNDKSPNTALNTKNNIKKISKNSLAQSADTQCNKTQVYDAMEIDALYKEVKTYLVNRGVNKKLIELTELSERFGEQNIKKLIKKSYLILIGKGVTIGR